MDYATIVLGTQPLCASLNEQQKSRFAESSVW
jgi:hypothetical protein